MHLHRILPHDNYTNRVLCLPEDTLEWWRKDVMRCFMMQLLTLNLAAFQDLLILQQCVPFFSLNPAPSSWRIWTSCLPSCKMLSVLGQEVLLPTPSLSSFAIFITEEKGWEECNAITFSSSCIHLKNSELQVQPPLFLFYFWFFSTQIPLD